MSPAFVSVFPATVNLLGGQQSARTLHFFVTLALVLFLLVHVGMVWFAGFKSRMRAMITGSAANSVRKIPSRPSSETSAIMPTRIATKQWDRFGRRDAREYNSPAT
jgi:nitrate reductase NapE component